MYQDTTAILCIEKLKIEPAVTYIAELSLILRAASDAYLAAFFFLLLSASSVYSVLCPASQRGTIMLYKAFLKPHFHIVHVKSVNLHPL